MRLKRKIYQFDNDGIENEINNATNIQIPIKVFVYFSTSMEAM